MKRSALLVCLTVAIAGLASLLGAAAARADDEAGPICRVTAQDPYDSGGTLYANGTMSCTDGGQPWLTWWTVEGCLQKWVRPDDQFYDAHCETWNTPTDATSRPLNVSVACSDVGYGEYRYWTHVSYNYFGVSRHDWAISNVAWACAGR